MVKKNLTGLIFSCCLSFVCVVPSGYASEAESRKHVLENGMVVLIKDMPSSSSISVDAYVKTGSATEGKYLGSGVSHFVEHMLFKGTQQRAVGDIGKEARALGGIINASTGYDYTIYTLELPAGSFDKAIDIISDMIMNSIFDPGQVEKEREVIYGEMRLREDNPDRVLSQLVFSSIYIRHPYRHPIIGYKPILSTISRDDLVDYYKTHYVPNNIILSVAGNFGGDDVIGKVKEVFKDFKPNPYLLRNLPPEPDQISMRWVEKEYPTDLTRLAMGYQGVNVLNKDMMALDVLAMILGAGESSRLYKTMFKESGIVKTVSSYNFTPMETGFFKIDAILSGNDAEEAVRVVQEQVGLVKKRGVRPEELEKAKRLVLSDYVFGHQTASSVGYMMAINEAFLGDRDFSKRYVEGVSKITNADILRVANTYLTDDNLTVAVLKPEEKNDHDSLPGEEKAEAPIEKIILDNGTTLLLREDHTFPIVAIRAAFLGGTRAETEDTNGISQLTSQVWVKGTKSRSAEKIAASVESLGASVSGFSGRNSLGLSLDLLSQDVEFGIALLSDLIKNPTFPEEEILKEKEKIITAILASKEHIASVTANALRQSLFTGSLRFDPLGTFESIEKASREDIVEFYQKFVVPNNMVLAVFGDFKKADILRMLKKDLAELKAGAVEIPVQIEKPHFSMVEKNLEMNKKQAMVMVGFQGPSIKSEDREGTTVLTSILGSSMSGRIFTKIRDELGKAYTLGGSYIPGLDAGFIYFYVLTSDEDALKVKELLLQEIQKMQDGLADEAELKDTKDYLKGTHLMGLETNASLGFSSALDELYAIGYDSYKQYNDRIDRVTKEDVKRLAQAYLDLDHAVVVVTRPSMIEESTR